jgi:hypothetical protein
MSFHFLHSKHITAEIKWTHKNKDNELFTASPYWFKLIVKILHSYCYRTLEYNYIYEGHFINNAHYFFTDIYILGSTSL